MFLHNMLVCNNSIISCMMPMYMQSNEYIQLCERYDISAQQTITSIRCHLFQKFCSSVTLAPGRAEATEGINSKVDVCEKRNTTRNSSDKVV